jgi:D-glycero-D-manno-heptose 1,7-bisphosphate phosphatase
MKIPAVFLDRDGVINHDAGYVWRTQEIRFIDGIFHLVGAIRAAGFLTIVVTNQAGVARGYFTEEDVRRLHDWLRKEFRTHGVEIDAFYYCPFHPAGTIPRYRADSPDRKPAPGMILRAAAEWSVDLSRSVLVGDKESDIEAGRRARVGTLILYDPVSDNEMLSCGDYLKTGSLRTLARHFDSLSRRALPQS